MTSQKSSQFTLYYAISLGLQLGFLIIAPILGFLLLGKWLDGFFGSEPFVMLVGIGIGLVVTWYELYHTFYPLLYPDHDAN